MYHNNSFNKFTGKCLSELKLSMMPHLVDLISLPISSCLVESFIEHIQEIHIDVGEKKCFE